MSCTIKICVGQVCLVIAFFAESKFAQAIGYTGNASSMDLSGLSAEPEFKEGTTKPSYPLIAQLSAEIGVGDKRFTNSFKMKYDKSTSAYVWDDAQAAKAWFVEVEKKAGSLADASGSFTFEGFGEYPDVIGFIIKNNGTVLEYVPPRQ